MEADDTTERAALDAFLVDLESDASFMGTLCSPRAPAPVCSVLDAFEDASDDVFAALEQLYQSADSGTSTLQDGLVGVQQGSRWCLEKAGTSRVRAKRSGGNLARKREREEIHTLRNAAMRLESQLVFLKRKDRGRGLESLDAVCGAQRSGLASGGEEARSTALENAYLKKLRNDHTKAIDKFAKALRNFKPLTLSEIMGASTACTHTSVPSYPRCSPDAMVFKRFAQNVDMHYHQLNQVFHKIGLTGAVTDIEDAQLGTSHDGGGAALTFTSSRVIPFQPHQVNGAATRLRNSGTIINLKGRGQMYEYSATSIATEIQFVVDGVTFSLRGISKRFYEHGRTVFVWDGVSEWLNKSTGQIVSIEERSWGVLKPVRRSGKGARSFPASLLQSYVCLTPGVSREMTRRDKCLSFLSDIVLPTYQQHFAAHMQLLENVLLEQSLS